MKRRLSTLAAAVSLMLCVATVALWVRGYFACDGFILGTMRNGCQLMSIPGGVYGAWFDSGIPVTSRWVRSRPDYNKAFSGGSSFARFKYGCHVRRTGSSLWPYSTLRCVRIPHWAIFSIAGCAAVVFTQSARQWRTTNRDLCPSCGYDLRATPDRCPECGTVPAGASGAV